MARIVNVHEAKTNLSRLLVEVAEGNEIVIARAGEPVARLVPVQPSQRETGFASSLVWIADDFDETPAEVTESFYQ